MIVNSKYSQVDGRKIHYLHGGKGKPLIFHHSYLTNTEIIRGLMEYLAESFEIFAPDFPGFGLSSPLPVEPKIKTGAKVLNQWIESLKLDHFYIGGISMGGAVAALNGKALEPKIKGYVFIEPFYSPKAFKLPKLLNSEIQIMASIFNHLVPLSVGEKLWSNKDLLIKLSEKFNPMRQHKIPMTAEQEIKLLNCAEYKTFWSIMQDLFTEDLSNEKPISNKQAVLVMSSKDDSLDYMKTSQGYKRLFPNVRIIPIELSSHYPTEHITVRYLKSHFHHLLPDVVRLLSQSTSSGVASKYDKLT